MSETDKLSVTLNFLKIYFKDVREICRENLDEFKYVKIVGVKSTMHDVSKWTSTFSKLPVWQRIVIVNLIMHNVSKWSHTL